MTAAAHGKAWPYGRRGIFEGELRSAAAEWFAVRGYPVSPHRPYCLADHDDWSKNIIDPEVVSLIRTEIASRRDAAKPFPLHKYVHHGLSSQAMLFNLVGPLIVRRDLAPLETAMKAVGVEWPTGEPPATFEFEDRSVFNEQQAQPTSVDLVIGDPSQNGAIFIEGKLKEPGFGGCSLFTDGDCNGENPAANFDSCYLHHIGRTYLQALKQHGFLEGALATDSTCPLANHYQFYRELLLALERRGVFVLLADDRSPVFRSQGTPERGLWPLLSRHVPRDAQRHMAYVSIQSTVKAIDSSGRHPWVSEFKRKYGIA